MKTHTVTTYTVDELKSLFPEGYARAFKRFQHEQDPCPSPWADETHKSLKAVIKAASARIVDCSIAPYAPSYLDIGLPDDVGELYGKRAFAWLENNLLGALRKPYAKPAQRYASEIRYKAKRPFTLAGDIPAGPFTGYYADDAFLDALRQSVINGDTLQDAFENLALTCRDLLQQDVDQARSEENFEASCDYVQFTSNGDVF